MRKREVVSVLIRNDSEIFMRSLPPRLGRRMDVLDLFGGEIEKGESVKDAASRHIGEQTSLWPQAHHFGQLQPIELAENYTRLGLNRTGILVAQVVVLPVQNDARIEAVAHTSFERVTRAGVEIALRAGQLSPIANKVFRSYPHELFSHRS